MSEGSEDDCSVCIGDSNSKNMTDMSDNSKSARAKDDIESLQNPRSSFAQFPNEPEGHKVNDFPSLPDIELP